jgi:hypothetical protein
MNENNMNVMQCLKPEERQLGHSIETHPNLSSSTATTTTTTTASSFSLSALENTQISSTISQTMNQLYPFFGQESVIIPSHSTTTTMTEFYSSPSENSLIFPHYDFETTLGNV